MSNERCMQTIGLAPLSVFPFFIVPAFFDGQGWLIFVAFIAVLVAYAGMLIIGIPIIALLNYFHATRWWQLTFAGAIGGAGMGWATYDNLPWIASAAGFGALVAGVAWLIGFKGRDTDTTEQ